MCIEVLESTVLEECSDDEIVYKVVRKKSLNRGTYHSLFDPNERSVQRQLNILLEISSTENRSSGLVFNYFIGRKRISKLNSPLIYCFPSLEDAKYYVEFLLSSNDIFSLTNIVHILACKAEGWKFYGQLTIGQSYRCLKTINVEAITPIEEIQ
jgi:hypothetical protein